MTEASEPETTRASFERMRELRRESRDARKAAKRLLHSVTPVLVGGEEITTFGALQSYVPSDKAPVVTARQVANSFDSFVATQAMAGYLGKKLRVLDTFEYYGPKTTDSLESELNGYSDWTPESGRNFTSDLFAHARYAWQRRCGPLDLEAPGLVNSVVLSELQAATLRVAPVLAKAPLKPGRLSFDQEAKALSTQLEEKLPWFSRQEVMTSRKEAIASLSQDLTKVVKSLASTPFNEAAVRRAAVQLELIDLQNEVDAARIQLLGNWRDVVPELAKADDDIVVRYVAEVAETAAAKFLITKDEVTAAYATSVAADVFGL